MSRPHTTNGHMISISFVVLGLGHAFAEQRTEFLCSFIYDLISINSNCYWPIKTPILECPTNQRLWGYMMAINTRVDFTEKLFTFFSVYASWEDFGCASLVQFINDYEKYIACHKNRLVSVDSCGRIALKRQQRCGALEFIAMTC